jgi:hypothetical protein
MVTPTLFYDTAAIAVPYKISFARCVYHPTFALLTNILRMRYYMFIDESGEANINKPDPRFDIFVLCSVIFREDYYTVFDKRVKELKKKFFGNEDVIFHSVEMRKKQNAFKVFQNENVLNNFYTDIGAIFTECNYHIISCVINKGKYKERYPDRNHAYEESLTFLCERAISLIGRKNKEHTIHLCLEKRQNQKDSQLKMYFTNFVKYGTEYYSTDEFKMCHPKLHFRGKEENTNGLQLADLCAYPIARKHLTPLSPQPTFEIIKPKLYCNHYTGNYHGLGIKLFP